MIALLRAASFGVNLLLFLGVPRLLGLPWAWAAAAAFALFALAWWGAGRVPRSDPAPAEVQDAAARAARRLHAPAPVFVRTVPGWTAGAVRAGRGYGLLLGTEVAAEHREAVLAHEIAHYLEGDLFWEPFTDGPARLLLEAARAVPPVGVIAVPFLILAAPLARLTELRADRLAASLLPGYSVTLGALADKMGPGAGILYPSLGARLRHSARDSKSASPAK